MVKKNILGIIIFASIIASTLGYGCLVTDFVSIGNYTITCYERPTGINSQGGDFERSFKFVMLNSVEDTVDRTYFLPVTSSDFCHKVIAINNTWHTINIYAFESFGAVNYMDLSDNKIVNINREAFGNLRHLKFLNLSSNSIESFFSNSFQMYEDHPLQELDLSHNRIKRIDGELNELSNLNILHLQYNQLKVIIDDAFLNLKNLTYLNLQHNLLTSVGSSLLYLESLETLDLSNNYLTKLSADDVSGLISIVNFNISHNELISVEPNCFSGAQHLQTLDFSFNNIEMTIDENMFMGNHELTYLNFYHNKIVGVHESAFKDCDLQYLNLDKNNINGNDNKFLISSKNSSSSVLAQNNVASTESNTSTDVNKTDDQTTNTPIAELPTSDKEIVNKLKDEIQAIRVELNNLNSTVANLAITLNNFGSFLSP